MTSTCGGKRAASGLRTNVRMSGNRKAAEEAIHMLTELSARKYVRPYNVATFHAGLGEMESAFCLLEKAYETRDVRLVFLLVDPRWDSERYAITSEKRHLGKSQA